MECCHPGATDAVTAGGNQTLGGAPRKGGARLLDQLRDDKSGVGGTVLVSP